MSKNEIISVSTKEGMLNAIKAKYQTIVIGGKDAQEIARIVRRNETTNKLSDLGLVISVFYPPVFFVGIFGKLLTKEIRKYEIVDMDDEFVTIKRQKK